MHILLLNQFYPPDVAPTGQVAHDLARCLCERGHAVTVLSSRQGYAGAACYPPYERRDGVSVQRLATLGFGAKGHWRKLFSYASFYLAVLGRLATVRPRPDVIVALTTPPYIGLLARLVGCLRRWRRVHWIMDLYPDVMQAHGMLPAGLAGHWLAAGLRWLTRREFGGAAAVITLGPDMSSCCARHRGSGGRVEWVPLWAADSVFVADVGSACRLRRDRGWDNDLVLLYSGNLGLGHRFDEFLAAAVALAPGAGCPSPVGAAGSETEPSVASRRSVRFVFAGGGRRRPEVDAFARSHPQALIEVMDYVALDDLGIHLASADVLLASLEPAWAGCMLPSKIQAMLASGRPVIFVGPSDSSPACWIEAAGAGWTVAPGDVEALLACIEQARDPAERARRGAAARAYAAAHFDRRQNCARMADLIERAVDPGQPTERR